MVTHRIGFDYNICMRSFLTETGHVTYIFTLHEMTEIAKGLTIYS